ncbi:sulfotransferase family 2 domain-containing protein [Marinimicrobium sp. ARAG 43.8]|uniref:sulfotransferase family 2 domain-containing protein n=1 Tax=Marinimicrobium sp. ARAG 43.8 TaxID=3418719 RepID=UPI003CED18BB
MRHPKQFEHLRKGVNQHPEGNFSLRGFTEREAIFVHITKSAGTSVALSLFGELPYHYTAWHYRVIFGRKAFNRFFKFTFVRNPWDRLYSAYQYLKNGGWDDKDRVWAERHWGDITSFEQFVTEWLTPERLSSHLHLRPQSYFLKDARGRVMVDYLGYFEHLPEDFARIAKHVNPEARLAHTNASKRGDYRDVYNRKMIHKVGKLYSEDVDSFGYGFDTVQRRKVVDQKLVGDSE